MKFVANFLLVSFALSLHIQAQDQKQLDHGSMLKMTPPINQEDLSSVFVNVNITQNTAPQNEPRQASIPKQGKWCL